MANRPIPDSDLVDTWSTKVAEAHDTMLRDRAKAAASEKQFRTVVCNAFGAGLTVWPIKEATVCDEHPKGLSVDRLYQINRGVRK